MEVHTFRIQIWSINKRLDRNKWAQAAHQLGIDSLTGCFEARIFFVRGHTSSRDIQRLASALLADPVTEQFNVSVDETMQDISNAQHSIEVSLLPGVTDPAAENLIRAAFLSGIEGIEQASTGQRYELHGDLSSGDLHQLAAKVFSNPVIQRFSIDTPISPLFVEVREINDSVEIIPVGATSDDDLMFISQQRRLSLNLEEMQAVRTYCQEEDRDLTDVEIEMIAQTWSEHCVHKTFKAIINYTGPMPGTDPHSQPVEQQIDSLLKTYIRKATDELNKDWVRSAFVDNAGIIRFDDTYDIAFKVETHNHPSAIEPFGGANTGVGGVVRDVLGVSARPIANTDILCFGPDDMPHHELPEGVLHPRQIAHGVIHGVEDYGNKMGIPTVNGAILYHEGYTANPLVFCGCVGILPHGSHRTEAQPGDWIVVIGGRTGRDGLRGATFSSMEMDGTTGEVAGSSVQIGHPINEKQVQEVILRARDEQLYNAITDCGAGGLSSAVGEMGEKLGICVQLETVPLKYPGLRPWEIWLSEAQERMVLAVPPKKWERLQTVCKGQDVEVVCIGTFESTGRLKLYYGDRVVGDLSMKFLYQGIPRMHLRAEWKPNDPVPLHAREGLISSPTPDLSETLLNLLAHPNIRSKEAIVRRYDHEVQGGIAVKPMVGVREHGPGDATVIVPLDTLLPTLNQAEDEIIRGLAVSNGICPQYGEIDPYTMSWAAVDEALRNLVAVGADPDQIAILDNFCWGNPQLPDRLGALVRAAQGCYDAALAYGVPFISGKDSLNNEFMGADGQRHAIPGTLLISAIGIVPDVMKTVTMDLKQPGNPLYIVGETRDEMGGSHYNLINGIKGGTVPQPNPHAIETMRVLHRTIQDGLVVSCHDVSEGGIAVALAEMCIAGGLGAASQERINLYSETSGRFIVELRPEREAAFLEAVGALSYQLIGQVTVDKRLHVASAGAASSIIDLPLDVLEQAWRGEIKTNAPVKMQSKLSQQVGHVTQSGRTSFVRTGAPRVVILHANGTNRDREAALACEIARGEADIVHVNQLINGEKHLLDYHFLVIPGGFSYGDDLGAGVLWALDLRHRLQADVEQFVREGRPVLGICNGFQALVKSGLLPGKEFNAHRPVTLTYNESGHFECRWVYLRPNPSSPSLFLEGIDELIYCPVAHGEGRVAIQDEATAQYIWEMGLNALLYVDYSGNPVGYPGNPNGSDYGIAALCNPAGNVMGLMPHPEDHLFHWQHPRYHRGERGMMGIKLFENGIKYA